MGPAVNSAPSPPGDASSAASDSTPRASPGSSSPDFPSRRSASTSDCGGGIRYARWPEPRVKTGPRPRTCFDADPSVRDTTSRGSPSQGSTTQATHRPSAEMRALRMVFQRWVSSWSRAGLAPETCPRTGAPADSTAAVAAARTHAIARGRGDRSRSPAADSAGRNERAARTTGRPVHEVMVMDTSRARKRRRRSGRMSTRRPPQPAPVWRRPPARAAGQLAPFRAIVLQLRAADETLPDRRCILPRLRSSSHRERPRSTHARPAPS